MHMSAAGAAEESDEEYYEEEAGRGEAAPDDGDYVELDLERTLTWAGNAVSIQAGSEFRMPLLVPYPAVLAIQFEVDGGADIEFSLKFKEDAEQEESMLVEPTRVSDREGQLDIDTTGTCEIIWSNAHAWMSAKTLSYQLQLAPKLDVRWKRRLLAAVTASTDFRMLAAVEARAPLPPLPPLPQPPRPRPRALTRCPSRAHASPRAPGGRPRRRVYEVDQEPHRAAAAQIGGRQGEGGAGADAL